MMTETILVKRTGKKTGLHLAEHGIGVLPCNIRKNQLKMDQDLNIKK